jgi:hypothetical protein
LLQSAIASIRTGDDARRIYGGVMGAIRSKLLEAVGQIDIHDVGEEALVDILVNKIQAQEERIKALQGENAHERERLYAQQEQLRQEQKSLRRDPYYGAYGEFFFLGHDNRRYRLSLQGGAVMSLIERYRKLDWAMQQITPAHWELMEENEQKGKKI